MKIARLTAALCVFAGAELASDMRAQDATLTAPKRGDSSPVSDRKKGRPDAPTLEGGSARRTMEDTIQILAVKTEGPDAGGRCKVTVKVHYALISYAKGLLALGFNSKTSTRFVSVTQVDVERGAEEREITATIVPVTWPDKQPFKLYVSLSGEVRTKEWSLLAAVSQVLKTKPPPAPK